MRDKQKSMILHHRYYLGKGLKMEFKGGFNVKKSANEVKEFLINPKQFADCLLGLQKYEVMPTNSTLFKTNFKLDIMEMKIPHMSTLTAVVNAKILDKGNEIEIKGNGRSAGIGLKFNIALKFEESEGFTKLEWFADIGLGLLSKLMGDENIRKIAAPNINSIINCISAKLS